MEIWRKEVEVPLQTSAGAGVDDAGYNGGVTFDAVNHPCEKCTKNMAILLVFFPSLLGSR